MEAMTPVPPHTRKITRNMARRPFSTPRRNISGRVMARMQRAPRADRTSVPGRTSRSVIRESTVWNRPDNTAAASMHIQPNMYLPSTTSRVE